MFCVGALGKGGAKRSGVMGAFTVPGITPGENVPGVVLIGVENSGCVPKGAVGLGAIAGLAAGKVGVVASWTK